VVSDGSFDAPLSIETGQIGRYYTLTSTAQAARYLVERWPEAKRNSG
jgi:hypothetical protein